MEERIDSGLVPQIDLISMLKDIAKEWWAILTSFPGCSIVC